VEAGLSSVSFECATAGDADALVALRIAAMRDSLERIGRFDAQRARDRFLAGFVPERTWHVVADTQCVGFLALGERDGDLLLDHLYIDPRHQRRGLGGAVLERVCALADTLGRWVVLGALRESDANRFYARHGFVQVARTDWDNHYRRLPVGAAEPLPLAFDAMTAAPPG
jgi:GNAT superfamily N-acetyltransferase